MMARRIPPNERPRTLWGQWLVRRILEMEAVQEEVEGVLPPVSARMKFELRRKAVHVGAAVLAVPVLLFIPYWWALALALAATGIIIATHYVNERRLRHQIPPLYRDVVHEPVSKALDSTRRPHEAFPWAPVTFLVALIIVATAITFGNYPLAYAFAAFGILGVGDAASALIGVAYGKHKLPWNKRKSWEGVAAGVVAGFVAATLLASVDFSFQGRVFPPEWFGIAFIGALTGGLVESVPRVQDNIFVPVSALAAMLAVAHAAGLA